MTHLDKNTDKNADKNAGTFLDKHPAIKVPEDMEPVQVRFFKDLCEFGGAWIDLGEVALLNFDVPGMPDCCDVVLKNGSGILLSPAATTELFSYLSQGSRYI